MGDERGRVFPTSDDMADRLSTTALTFRGYNVTNLGRSPELLSHAKYGPVLARYLSRGSSICSEVVGYHVDLVSRVREVRETSLSTYAEAVALVVSSSLAQLEMLQTFFATSWREARFSFGFSLGEISALIAGGVFSLEEGIQVPLELAPDCVELAEGTTLGVLFSRHGSIALGNALKLCEHINQEGKGVIGISAILAPNSLLLIGQGETLSVFSQRMEGLCDERLYLRKNQHVWPPLHTPITWQKAIPNRSELMMQTVSGGFVQPLPNVFSLVTGRLSYTDWNVRQILGEWVDRPQRLWDAVEYSLTEGITRVIHVGPAPNIVPSTYDRLAIDVEAQIKSRTPIRALSQMVRRPWLQAMLPKRASLLRAPLIEQVILEDWLLHFGDL